MRTRDLTNARATAARKQHLGSKENKDRLIALAEDHHD